MIEKVALKRLNAIPGRTFVFAVGGFVVGDEVYFELQAMQESDQPLGIGNVVGEILDQDIFEGNPFSCFERVCQTAGDQFFQVISFVDRHQLRTHGVIDPIERNRQVGFYRFLTEADDLGTNPEVETVTRLEEKLKPTSAKMISRVVMRLS